LLTKAHSSVMGDCYCSDGDNIIIVFISAVFVSGFLDSFM